MYDPNPIAIVAPAPARRMRFANGQQALAYYQAVGVKTYEDCMILAEFALVELEKINRILDEAFPELREGKTQAVDSQEIIPETSEV